jgi:hypothetical protein
MDTATLPIIKSKRRGSGKNKGSEFERRVCRALSLWISRGRDQDLFWRSTTSGARATSVKDRKLAHVAGDISAYKEKGFVLTKDYFIECKSYTNLQYAQFCAQEQSVLGKFWAVAQRQAISFNRAPLLIAKQNRCPVMILMQPNHWRRFGEPGTWYLANQSVVMMRFQEFVEHARTDQLGVRERFASN